MAKDQWDENLRGKKMSTQTGLTIYKYQMPVKEQFTLELPEGAEILRVDDDNGMFWLWALVDIRKPDTTRRFRAFKCGAPIPDDVDIDSLEYLGWGAIFVQQELALYIFEEHEIKAEEANNKLLIYVEKYRQYEIFGEEVKLSASDSPLFGYAAYNSANVRLPEDPIKVFGSVYDARCAVDKVWKSL